MLSALIGNLAYNVDVEIAFFIVSLIIFVVMIGTKPRRTSSYVYDFFGMFFCIVAPFLMTLIVYMASHIEIYGIILLQGVMIAYIFVYSFILFNLSMYLCTLPYRNRNKEGSYRILCLCFVFFMVFYCMVAVFKGSMVSYEGGEIADISMFIIKMVNCGMVSSTASMIFALTVTKDMPKVVRIIVFAVYPLDVFLLLVQRSNTDDIVIAMTYVVPMCVFYILFHSNPYDEILGLQNTYSLESRFEDNIFLKKPFYIGYLIIPSFNRSDVAGPSSKVGAGFEAIISYCRMAEAKYPNLHIYKQSAGTYTFIYEAMQSDEHDKKLDELADIAEARLKEIDELARIIMVVLPCFEEIRTIAMAREMVNQLIRKKLNPLENFRYVATQEDNRLFQERYKIEQELMDIRLGRNMEDERIVCYAQPIYEVETESFRTAEALMRLKVNGDMVAPGLFIPIAEETDCIHMLTLIILSKVCKELKELEKDYEFECISINCSASEFALPGLANEILDIIKKFEVDPKKIRLELTESAVADDNNSLRNNMYLLRQEGISFYLDDFGTGYSAMSRVIDLPFRIIKFDKSLLYQSIDDERMDGIVTNMIDTLKSSGINTLVEGVESDAHKDYSITHGFDYIQGYHYAKPVPISELRNYFAKKK